MKVYVKLETLIAVEIEPRRYSLNMVQIKAVNALDDLIQDAPGSLSFEFVRVATYDEEVLKDSQMEQVLNVPSDVLTLANMIVEAVSLTNDWPDDGWIGLSQKFDLNLWHSEDVNHAVIYPAEAERTRIVGPRLEFYSRDR